MKSDFNPSGSGQDSDRPKFFSVQRPFTIPSGVVSTSPSVLARMAREVDEIGFLTTKTLSLNPRPGYREPVLHEYHPGCFINAVGLANPGAANFAEAMRSLLPLHAGKPLLVSIMGSDPYEFLECAAILNDIADAFELNLSCPHVKAAGLSVGTDPAMVEKIVGLLCDRLQKPIVPKLSPNIANIMEIAKVCRDAGASGLSLINTVGPGIAVDDYGNPILSNVVGGISGAAVKPIGLKLVRELSSQVDLPIIASGGIASPWDVEAYRRAGACYFAIGSNLAGMTTPQIRDFFRWVASPASTVKAGSKIKKFGSKSGMTRYFRTRVASNKKISSNMFRLELNEGPKCDPGQFFFLRIPEVGEKPFSPMSDLKPVYLIRPVGPFTEKLSTLEEGAEIYFRGPYGKGFQVPDHEDKILVLGGGTGVAPILMAAMKWPENVVRVFLGFSQSLEEWFLSEIQSIAPESTISIDAPGAPGAIFESMERELSGTDLGVGGAKIYICGPRDMMKKAGDFFSRFVDPKDVYISREDVMKCGIGLCGSCGTENGLRSCIDGPVFPFSN